MTALLCILCAVLGALPGAVVLARQVRLSRQTVAALRDRRRGPAVRELLEVAATCDRSTVQAALRNLRAAQRGRR